MDIRENFYSKLQQIREQSEQLDELKMDHKTYVSAMKRATDYDADYAGDGNRIDTDKLVARAKKYKGKKFADDLKGADQMTERPNRNKVSGQWGSDQLAWRTSPRKTKDGKANKTDLKSLKGSLTKGDYRKPRFKKVALPEETEQLEELRQPKNIDKLKKHMGDAAQAASDAAYKKGSDHYDETTKKRGKAMKSKKKEDMDDATAEQDKMSKSWKRSIAFGKIADRKKKSKVDSVDESVAGLALGTLAAVPLAVAGMKSGVIPKAVDKTSAMLKKLKKKIQKKKLEEASSGKPPRSEHSWPTSLDKKTGKWMWANAFKGGHESAEAANKHAKEMIEKNKKTKVNLSDLKPRSK